MSKGSGKYDEASTQQLVNLISEYNIGYERELYKKNTHSVKELILKNANPNSTNKYNKPLTHIAVEAMDYDMVKLLLEMGGDIESIFTGKSLIYKSFGLKAYDIAKLLIESGANVNIKSHYDHHALPVIFMAFYENNYELVKLLLDKGADANSTNDMSMPLIESAFITGNLDLVKLLLDKGAHGNCSGGSCPLLHKAFNKGNFALVKGLMDNGANVDSNYRKMSFIDKALQLSNEQFIKDIMPSEQKVMGKLLKELVSRGKLELLDECLSAKNHEGQLKSNVNSIIDAEGNRLIDFVRQDMSNNQNVALLTLLRNHGSVEPKNPIGYNPEKLVMREDISPDLIEGNGSKAKKMLEIMEKNFLVLMSKSPRR